MYRREVHELGQVGSILRSACSSTSYYNSKMTQMQMLKFQAVLLISSAMRTVGKPFKLHLSRSKRVATIYCTSRP